MTRSAALALVTDAFGGRGGIAQYNRDFLITLASTRAGGLIVVLPRHAPDHASVPKGIVQRMPRSGRILYALGALIVSLCYPIDLVFCGHLYLAPLAFVIARLKKAKLIIQGHGIEVWSSPSRVCRAALESADLVLCVSRFTRAQILNWASIVPERVLAVPNTVDERFVPGDGTKLRAQLSLNGKCVLLTVGRLESRERYKGHDRVIASLPDLVARGHDVAYVIAGEGDDRARLEGLIRDSKVSDRVIFAGAVSPGRLPEMYCLADLFVMPSTGEGFGIAFLESMACGTPALGLAAGGSCDALGDGELGVAIANDQLVVAISRALSGPKRDRSELAAAVRARFGRDMFNRTVGAALKRLFDN